MNFFDQQEQARRKTTRLVVLFSMAVLLIVLALYFAALGIAVFVDAKRARFMGAAPAFAWWRPELFAAVGAAALGVIGLGSLYKMVMLRGGGAVLAARLGGTFVDRGTTDADERRLVNVVEEMAIASGIPVPDVFVLNEESAINAFAAGHTPADAAVAVTRGCLKTLDRDQLQGVIAHEFSHILNGDMRLNLRLMGILHGILVIGLIGIGILRGLGTGRVRMRGKNGGGAIVAAIAAGLALTIIGYAGLFFGRLIKAAVSRQREFLADASAVQFTRNPTGLAGALAKIARISSRSVLATENAEEASHLFFGNALSEPPLLASLLSTHPPVLDRIRRIDPGFDVNGVSLSPPPPMARAVAADEGALHLSEGMVAGVAPSDVVAAVGAPTARHLVEGARLIEALPDSVHAATQEPFEAVALTLALVLDEDPAAREIQLASLASRAPQPIYRETLRAHARLTGVARTARLPLLDMCAGSLRRLSPKQSAQLQELVTLLIQSDQRCTLFEFAVLKVLRRWLSGGSRPPTVQYYSVAPLLPDCVLLLSALCVVDEKSPAAARRAFDHGMSRLPPARRGAPVDVMSREQCSLREVEAALDRLGLASPAVKQRIIDACAFCIFADRDVTPAEGELMRAIAASLDCPLPPFLTGG